MPEGLDIMLVRKEVGEPVFKWDILGWPEGRQISMVDKRCIDSVQETPQGLLYSDICPVDHHSDQHSSQCLGSTLSNVCMCVCVSKKIPELKLAAGTTVTITTAISSLVCPKFLQFFYITLQSH